MTMITEYLDYMKNIEGAGFNTLKTYRIAMNKVAKILINIKDADNFDENLIKNLKRKDVKQMIAKFNDSENSYNTIKTNHRVLSAFLTYCIDYLEIIEYNVCKGITIGKVAKAPKDPKPFTDEQVTLLVNSATCLKFEIMVGFGLYCGLRASEIISIERSHIGQGIITIPRENSKNGEEAKLPIPKIFYKKVCEYLETLDGKSDYIFLTRNNEKYTYSGFRKVFLQMCKRSKIKYGDKYGYTIHSLRHTYITNLGKSCKEGKITLKEFQTLARHSDIKTTLNIYTHVTTNDLRKSIKNVFGEE